MPSHIASFIVDHPELKLEDIVAYRVTIINNNQKREYFLLWKDTLEQENL